MPEPVYLAIDMKSFYASVECVDRGLDPLTTNLVVADPSRTEKTICLAVSPSLKACGIPGRPRLFEVVQRTEQINALRLSSAPGHSFTGSSYDSVALRSDPALKLDYIVAPPRMARYMAVSMEVYQVYLRYLAPEDIHVYSVDEVFMDVTHYLPLYQATPRELAMQIIRDVLSTVGVTATAGIGTNLYLAKVAMDIVAKHAPADRDGARIAQLDEAAYRRELWGHRPITDFWRVGSGLAKRLKKWNLTSMGDIARFSLTERGEDLLYEELGVNAELLIDHAWGWESCTMADIKAYRPASSSLSSGQVLQSPYPFDKARLVVREMADALSLDLVEKGLVTDRLVLTVGYDRESLSSPEVRRSYRGEVASDHYGRKVPKQAHGSIGLGCRIASTRAITAAAMELFDRIVDPRLLVRRLYVVADHTVSEAEPPAEEQLDLFTDHAAQTREQDEQARERRQQQAVLAIRRKYGKNALLKGMDLEEGATSIARNGQIGGHKA